MWESRLTLEGLELIKSFESCRLEAYCGIDKIWTIGWGHTAGVKEGDICTQDQADQWLKSDLAETERQVLSCISTYLTSNQLSALISFTYNVGLGYKGIKDGLLSLVSGSPSTLLRLVRLRNFLAASEEFPKWDKVAGAPSDGILRRRMAERALFLKSL